MSLEIENEQIKNELEQTKNEIDSIKKENEDIKKEILNYKQAVDALNAQCDAAKQMYNDSMNTCFQLRTNNIILQKQLNSMENQNASDKKF